VGRRPGGINPPRRARGLTSVSLSEPEESSPTEAVSDESLSSILNATPVVAVLPGNHTVQRRRSLVPSSILASLLLGNMLRAVPNPSLRTEYLYGRAIAIIIDSSDKCSKAGWGRHCLRAGPEKRAALSDCQSRVATPRPVPGELFARSTFP
jgi:hypothetical protein